MQNLRVVSLGLLQISSSLILYSQMTYALIGFEPSKLPVRKVLSLFLAILIIFYTPSGNCHSETALSGEWTSTLALEVPTGTWSTKTDFTVEKQFGNCLMTARSLLEDDAWKKQEFEAEVVLADFAIETDLRFEPTKDRFKDWITKIEWEKEALTVTLITKLTRTTDWLILEIEHEEDTLEIDADIRFRSSSGSCSPLFYDVTMDLSFDWCGIETDLEVAIDDDGFDEIVLELSELAVPRAPWFTFDLELTRTAKTTTVKLSPDAILTSFWGVGYCELEIEGGFANASSIHPLSITEAVVTWETEGWEMEATAILDPGDWISKTYWLEVQAECAIDLGDSSCVSLELTFLWTETDLGRVRGAITYEPCESFSIATEGDVDIENRELNSLALSLEFEW